MQPGWPQAAPLPTGLTGVLAGWVDAGGDVATVPARAVVPPMPAMPHTSQ